MAHTKVYSAKKYIMTFGEVDMTKEKAKESFLTITKRGDAVIEAEEDLDHNSTIYMTGGNSFDIKYTCPRSSIVNDELSVILQTALIAGDPRLAVRALNIKDPNGSSSHFSGNCVLSNWPEEDLSEKPNTRSWMLIATDMENFFGGSDKI